MGVVKSFLGAVVLLVPFSSSGVYLNADGLGQALIFPYYTVQSSGLNAFNTYVAISNTTSQTKVLKVRFREGKNSRLVSEFNLYLSPNDMWTAALVPEGTGTRLISRDISCTAPSIPSAGLLFSAASYSDGSDGGGVGLERTREGHFEVIEMGVLTGSAAGNVNHDESGHPPNCNFVQGSPDLGALQPPSGGLYGGGTLINVTSGLDFTYDADALAGLTSVPFYSHPGEAGTDFDSPAVDPVSQISHDNVSYRLTWSRGLDAITSLFMGNRFDNEIVVDAVTRSRTDWVMTFPTRRFYVTNDDAQAPFTAPFGPVGNPPCEGLDGFVVTRDPPPVNGIDFPIPPPSGTRSCWSAVALSIKHDQPRASESDVFGSRNMLGFAPPLPPRDGFPNVITLDSSFENGRMSLGPQFSSSIVSLASSTALDLRTGTTASGRYAIKGWPATGFMARVFENGNLSCGAITCQGNYGGSFKHRRVRVIQPS